MRAIACLCAIAMCAAAPVRAQDAVPSSSDETTPTPPSPSAVDQRLAQGEVLFEAGNYDAALADFARAYDELEGDPERFLLLFNMGQCAERLFRYDEAITDYRRYLAEGGDAADGAADVRASIRALEGLLGTIVITTNVPSATVWVDGREAGAAPGELRIPGGPHTIELRAPGHASGAQPTTVAARERIEIRIVLAEVSSFEGMDPTVFGVTAGVAGATLVAALVTGSVALSMHDRELGRPADMRSLADQRTIADVALAADALWIAGGVLGIASIALAFLTDWDGHPDRPSDARLRLGPGALAVEGAF
jgi:tetratricopeptide (TPR) repeat protein